MDFVQQLKQTRENLLWSDHSYYSLGLKSNKAIERQAAALSSQMSQLVPVPLISGQDTYLLIPELHVPNGHNSREEAKQHDHTYIKQTKKRRVTVEDTVESSAWSSPPIFVLDHDTFLSLQSLTLSTTRQDNAAVSSGPDLSNSCEDINTFSNLTLDEGNTHEPAPIVYSGSLEELTSGVHCVFDQTLDAHSISVEHGVKSSTSQGSSYYNDSVVSSDNESGWSKDSVDYSSGKTKDMDSASGGAKDGNLLATIQDHTYEEDRFSNQRRSILKDHTYGGGIQGRKSRNSDGMAADHDYDIHP